VGASSKDLQPNQQQSSSNPALKLMDRVDFEKGGVSDNNITRTNERTTSSGNFPCIYPNCPNKNGFCGVVSVVNHLRSIHEVDISHEEYRLKRSKNEVLKASSGVLSHQPKVPCEYAGCAKKYSKKSNTNRHMKECTFRGSES